MALKLKISKADYDKLPADIKAEYAADGDDYKLDVVGIEDTGALKRAKDREKELRIEAETRAKKAEDRLTELEGDDARKKGDIDTLEKSWQRKQDEQKAEYEAKIAKRDAALKKSLIDDTALKIATKISNAPALLIPHIKARLQADLDGDTPATKVLDASGAVSTASLEDLEKEFVANKDFSAIIIAGKGSGGSTKNDQNRGGATKTNFANNNEAPIPAHKLSAKDLAAQLKERKEAADE